MLDKLLEADIEIGEPARPLLAIDDHSGAGESPCSPLITGRIGRGVELRVIPEANTDQIGRQLSESLKLRLSLIEKIDQIIPDRHHQFRVVKQGVDATKDKSEEFTIPLDAIATREDGRGMG